MTIKRLVIIKGLLCLRKAGPFAFEASHNPINFRFTQSIHDIQRPLSKTQGHLAAEIQIGPGADIPVNDIKGLRK